MRIVLIRHGPSACPSPQGLLDRSAVERWRTAYEAAGITPQEPPPRALTDLVTAADVAVASDVPRGVASASLLWPGRSVEYSALFREIPLRIPELGGVRLPFAVWSFGIHVQWGLDIVRGSDVGAGDGQRVADAAMWCDRACRDHGAHAVVAMVTHGVFRRALARRLVRIGWRLASSRRYHPWSAWTLMRSPAP